MGNFVYYYQFLKPGNQYSPGVYTTQYPNGHLFTLAHRCWIQGPRGGVQIISEHPYIAKSKKIGTGYKTKDHNAMREFSWVKLSAKEYTF